MRLTLHTDYALRVVIYLASLGSGERATTPGLAKKFHISANHLHKVVRTLGQLGLIHSTAGRNGGITLSQPAEAVRLGWLVKALEGYGQLVDCTVGPCPLTPACGLKRMLYDAELAFFDALDRHTLADAVSRAEIRNIIQFMKRTG